MSGSLPSMSLEAPLLCRGIGLWLLPTPLPSSPALSCFGMERHISMVAPFSSALVVSFRSFFPPQDKMGQPRQEGWGASRAAWVGFATGFSCVLRRQGKGYGLPAIFLLRRQQGQEGKGGSKAPGDKENS